MEKMFLIEKIKKSDILARFSKINYKIYKLLVIGL